MLDGAGLIASQDWSLVVNSILLLLFVTASIVGMVGFRKAENYAMDTINLEKENKQLRAEIAQLRIARGEDPPTKPSWE